MKEVVVSVIVPNYNHAAYLEQRIESILQQAYADFELILLDDASSDGSREVLLRYRDNPHVSRLLFNKENSGSPFKQWGKGIGLAQGKYVWIAESDDFADPDFLRTTVAALESNPDAVVAYTGSQMVDGNGQDMSLDWDKFKKDVPSVCKYDSRFFLSRKMLWSPSIYNASMALFRRECYAKVSREFMEFHYCGDWFFWNEVCSQGNVVNIRRKLNYFRQHDNKVSPRAEKEGLYFIEGGKVMQRTVSALHLSAYQQKVVCGRILKRFRSMTKHNELLRQRIVQSCPFFLQASGWYVWLYELDKWLNFSHLHG